MPLYAQFAAQIRNTLKGKLGLPPDFSKYARSPAVLFFKIPSRARCCRAVGL
jgi:hypothetical protein